MIEVVRLLGVNDEKGSKHIGIIKCLYDWELHKKKKKIPSLFLINFKCTKFRD